MITVLFGILALNQLCLREKELGGNKGRATFGSSRMPLRSEAIEKEAPIPNAKAGWGLGASRGASRAQGFWRSQAFGKMKLRKLHLVFTFFYSVNSRLSPVVPRGQDPFTVRT